MADRNISELSTPLYIGSGSDRMVIDTDGTISFEGEASTWDDLRAPLFGQKLSVTKGSVDYNYIEGTITFESGGSISKEEDVVLMNFQVPHAAKANSLFKFHIHWIQDSLTEREFTIQYRVQSNGAMRSTTWNTLTIPTSVANNVFTYTTGTINQITRLFDLDLTGAGISAIIQIRIARTDSEAGNIDGQFLDAHYQIDSVGSSNEYVK